MVEGRRAEGRRIVVVVKGWPRLSETFIAQELVGLERRGLELSLFALRHPTDGAVHALHRALKAPVAYLPEYLHDEPGRVLAALWRVRRRPGWRRALKTWWRDWRRDPTRSRLRRFGQAAVLVDELPPDAAWLYAHFLHTPASVARYAALLSGLPWSVSAHAKDIWTLPDWDKREKLAEARWGVTCTQAGRDHLNALAGAPAGGVHAVELIYHGLDFARFPALPPVRPPRDGSDPAQPAGLLSVGRAVPKKGFDVVLAALARLPPDLHWVWTHIGGGAGLDRLKRQARYFGLEERVHWLGPQPQDAVIAAYAAADLFVLPSRIAADGDRDGLPNVLMEAQTLGLATVATRVSAIPELIDEGRTGVLIPPDDPVALAAALAALIRDPSRRARLAAAGRARVRRHFAAEAGLDRLAHLLGEPVRHAPAQAVEP